MESLLGVWWRRNTLLEQHKMRYKAEFRIEVEFKCNDTKLLKEKLWNSIEKPFSKCIFGNKEEELKFVTLTDETGKVINLKKHSDNIA